MAKRMRRIKRRRAEHKRAGKPRAGMPNPASVVDEKTFVSPAGRSYRILRTTEHDPYDPPSKTKPKRW